MGDNDIQTAETTAETQSDQTSKPKGKGSGARGPKRVRYNERGVPVTQWDVPENDPNLRKHVGESPNGEGNVLK